MLLDDMARAGHRAPGPNSPKLVVHLLPIKCDGEVRFH